jgi:hypothetical protein
MHGLSFLIVGIITLTFLNIGILTETFPQEFDEEDTVGLSGRSIEEANKG